MYARKILCIKPINLHLKFFDNIAKLRFDYFYCLTYEIELKTIYNCCIRFVNKEIRHVMHICYYVSEICNHICDIKARLQYLVAR